MSWWLIWSRLWVSTKSCSTGLAEWTPLPPRPNQPEPDALAPVFLLLACCTCGMRKQTRNWNVRMGTRCAVALNERSRGQRDCRSRIQKNPTKRLVSKSVNHMSLYGRHHGLSLSKKCSLYGKVDIPAGRAFVLVPLLSGVLAAVGSRLWVWCTNVWCDALQRRPLNF